MAQPDFEPTMIALRRAYKHVMKTTDRDELVDCYHHFTTFMITMPVPPMSYYSEIEQLRLYASIHFDRHYPGVGSVQLFLQMSGIEPNPGPYQRRPLIEIQRIYQIRSRILNKLHFFSDAVSQCWTNPHQRYLALLNLTYVEEEHSAIYRDFDITRYTVWRDILHRAGYRDRHFQTRELLDDCISTIVEYSRQQVLTQLIRSGIEQNPGPRISMEQHLVAMRAYRDSVLETTSFTELCLRFQLMCNYAHIMGNVPPEYFPQLDAICIQAALHFDRLYPGVHQIQDMLLKSGIEPNPGPYDLPVFTSCKDYPEIAAWWDNCLRKLRKKQLTTNLIWTARSIPDGPAWMLCFEMSRRQVMRKLRAALYQSKQVQNTEIKLEPPRPAPRQRDGGAMAQLNYDFATLELSGSLYLAREIHNYGLDPETRGMSKDEYRRFIGLLTKIQSKPTETQGFFDTLNEWVPAQLSDTLDKISSLKELAVKIPSAAQIVASILDFLSSIVAMVSLKGAALASFIALKISSWVTKAWCLVEELPKTKKVISDWITELLNSIRRPFDVPTTQVSEDEHLFVALVKMFGHAIFGIGPNKVNEDRAKRLHNILGSFNTMHTFFTKFGKFFEGVIDYVSESLGFLPIFDAVNPILSEKASAIVDEMGPFLANQRREITPVAAQQIVDIKRRADTIYTDIVKTESRRWTNWISMYHSFAHTAAVAHEILGVQGTRVRPLTLYLTGRPGIGKTTMSTNIARQVELLVRGKPPEGTNLYQRILTEKYWSGYHEANHFAVMMDEAWSTKDAAKNTETSTTVLALAGAATCPLEMPFAGQKGETFFRSKMLFLTSNHEDLPFQHTNIFFPEALARRVYCVEVTVITTDYDPKTQKWSRARNALAFDDDYRFNVYTYTATKERVPHVIDLSYTEFIYWCAGEVLAYEDQYLNDLDVGTLEMATYGSPPPQKAPFDWLSAACADLRTALDNGSVPEQHRKRLNDTFFVREMYQFIMGRGETHQHFTVMNRASWRTMLDELPSSDSEFLYKQESPSSAIYPTPPPSPRAPSLRVRLDYGSPTSSRIVSTSVTQGWFDEMFKKKSVDFYTTPWDITQTQDIEVQFSNFLARFTADLDHPFHIVQALTSLKPVLYKHKWSLDNILASKPEWHLKADVLTPQSRELYSQFCMTVSDPGTRSNQFVKLLLQDQVEPEAPSRLAAMWAKAKAEALNVYTVVSDHLKTHWKAWVAFATVFVAALGSLFAIIWYAGLATFDGESQNTYEAIRTHKPKLEQQRVQKLFRKKDKAESKVQISDRQLMDQLAKIGRGFAIIEVVTTGVVSGHLTIRALNVKGNQYIVPLHAFAYAFEERNKLSDTIVQVYVGGLKLNAVPFDQCDIIAWADDENNPDPRSYDLITIRLPKHLGHRGRDLTDLFIKESEVDERLIAGGVQVSDLDARKDNSVLVESTTPGRFLFYHPTVPGSSGEGIKAHNSVSDSTMLTSRGLEMGITNKPGDCGKLYAINNSLAQHKFFGMHLSGAPPNRSQAALLTQEVIREFTFDEPYEIIDPLDLGGTNKELEIAPVVTQAAMAYVPLQSRVLGRVPQKHYNYLNRESKLTRTTMFPDAKPVKIPVIMKKLPDGRDPFLLAIARENIVDYTPISLCKAQARAFMRQRVERLQPTILKGWMDIEEAINKPFHSMTMNPMRLQTSAGFGLVAHSGGLPGKTAYANLIEFDPEHPNFSQMPTDQLREAIKAVISEAENGRLTMIPHRPSLKDELRDVITVLEKVKTRVFKADGIVHWMIGRMAYGAFFDAYSADPFGMCHAIGANMTGPFGEYLAQRLATGIVHDHDISNNDNTLWRERTENFISDARHFMRRIDREEPSHYGPVTNQRTRDAIRDLFDENARNPTFVIGDVLYSKAHTTSSGDIDTTMKNSHANKEELDHNVLLILLQHDVDLYKRVCNNLTEYEKLFFSNHCGDDTIACFPPSATYLNFDSLCEAYARFQNRVITDPAKERKNADGTAADKTREYLSRTITKFHGKTVWKLRASTIENIPYWRINSLIGEPAMCSQLCDAALNEWFFHGKDVFDRYKQLYDQELQRLRYPLTTRNWSAIMADWLAHY